MEKIELSRLNQNFGKKIGLSRLNPNLWRWKRVEPAQPEFLGQIFFLPLLPLFFFFLFIRLKPNFWKRKWAESTLFKKITPFAPADLEFLWEIPGDPPRLTPTTQCYFFPILMCLFLISNEFPWNFHQFDLSICRDKSDIGVCMTSVFAKSMQPLSADFWFQNVFDRRICWKLALNRRILFASTEVMHTPRDPTFLYISILRTYTIFVLKNKILALGVCLTQNCWWARVWRVKIAFELPLNIWFVSTKTWWNAL